MAILPAHHPDVTLFLDVNGVIREAAFANALSGERSDAWIGRRWTETVSGSGTAKVERLVADAKAHRVSAFRQLEQRFPSGAKLLMEYTAVRLGPRAGLVAVGKSLQSVAALQSSVLAAQQAVERDYWRLRTLETRYRLLFNAAALASVMVEAATLTIVEANAAAFALLRPGAARARADEPLVGRELTAEFAADDREALLAMLRRVRERGASPALLLRLNADRAPVTVRASLLSSNPSTVFLLELAPLGAGAKGGSDTESLAEALLENHPYGFAVVRREGTVLRANRAFLDMVQIGAARWAAGEKLSRWLDFSDAELRRMIEEAFGSHGAPVKVATLRGQLGREIRVEIAFGAAGQRECVGVTLRPLQPAGSLGELVETFGRTSLRETLRGIARQVERQCVLRALELRNGDLAAAAAILGLSLRGLKARLRRLRGPKA